MNQYNILMYISKIEKAISMPNRKKVYAQNNVIILLKILKKAKKIDKKLISSAYQTIDKYMKNINFNIVKNKNFIKIFNIHLNKSKTIKTPKFKTINKTEFTYDSFLLLCKKRRSVRNFLDEKIDYLILKKALDCAKEYPSACNRSGSSILFIENEKTKNAILNIQKGNQGIKTPNLIAVITDKEAFFQDNEEYTSHFHGGMFTSYILLAFESLGYSTCCLNWHVSQEDNAKGLQLLNLDSNKIINCFIIVGKNDKSKKEAYSFKASHNNLLKTLSN